LYSGGSFTTIDVPGSNSHTIASGINDSGQIVGYFFDTRGVEHGFVDTSGSFTTIDVPGAQSTTAYGINDSGQIVGSFSNGPGGHGFLASPAPVPVNVPSSVLTLATCLVAIVGIVWLRKRASAGNSPLN
jgi:probable HAF family extracellular repeat protein